MSDDREQRVRRAREVLRDAGWLFDGFVNAEMKKVLTSDPDDMTTREVAYNRARVATEMKAGLMGLVEEADDSALLAARREKLMEKKDGRRDD